MWLNENSGWTEDDHIKFITETQYLQDELDSEVIDNRLKYSKQAEIVKQALKEAFGEYANDIKIVNRFFFRLENFMKDLQVFQQYTWKKEGQEYEGVLDKVRMSGNDIKWVLIDYWMDARKKIREDLTKEWKEKPEIDKILKWKSDKFLSLLRERITYEP